MNDLSNWQTANAHYLSLAVEWLRLKLSSFGQTNASTVVSMPSPVSTALTPASEANVSAFWQQLFTAPNNKQASPSMAATDGKDQEIDNGNGHSDQLQAELEAAAKTDPPPALVLLARQLGLTLFEQNILLLCATMELDTRVAGLCAQAQDNPNRPYPTFALALSLFDDPTWDALSPDRPLRYWRLLEINQPGAQPLTSSALRADERIVSFLKGLNTLDDRLAGFIHPINAALTRETGLPPSQQELADQIIAHWQNAPADLSLPVAQLVGPDPISKQLIAFRAASALGRQLYLLSADALPASHAELESLSRLWQRESILLPLALYLDAQEIDINPADHSAPVQRFLARTDGVMFFGTREIWSRLARANFSIEVDKPTTAEQQAAWNSVLGDRSPELARQLAAQFNLNVITIHQIAQGTLNDPEIEDEIFARNIWEASANSTRPRMDALAQRLDPKATWDDLVLPAEQTTLLHQIAEQVKQRHTVYEDWGFAAKMNRGLGISTLFSGESGTGKTMAAEVIANALHLNLYRIDLSAVVSKYIGETEKNLRRLFDVAEDGGALLFFDEADALFGKRSEVRDSHDRYANIEINYLLQRMEAYRGLAILATNMKSALDQAFLRRLRFIVNFPFPSPSERKLIWQKVFPAQVPKDELDYERLGRFNITGGNIHSIALNTAFMAAQTNSKVTMPMVLSATRTEFRKLEKPISEAEFLVN
jgi:ATPase family protein associated with various cellular activities (AAA)/winged helix domain-containing protein